MVCTFHLRVTTPELWLQPRVCPSDRLGAAPGVDPWHLLEKWSIKCAPKQRIQKGTCCREPHDGSTAKSIDLRMTHPSVVPVTSGFPCWGGWGQLGQPSSLAPARPSSCSMPVCLPAATSCLCVFLFQPLLSNSASRNTGKWFQTPWLQLYPGRTPGPEACFRKPSGVGGAQLSPALPPPHPTPSGGCSSFCQPSPGTPWRMGQSISAPGLQTHCNLLKARPGPNSHLKTKILSNWLFTISLNGP